MFKKVVLAVVLIVVFGLIAFYFMQNGRSVLKNPFQTKMTLNYPSYITADAGNRIYIIDKSRRRIVIADNGGNVIREIDGGLRDAGTFFYANEITVDEKGYFYVINWVLDKAGFFMDREEILRYNPQGDFDSVVYTRDHTKDRKPTLVQRGQFLSISAKDGIVRWFDVDDAGIHLIKKDLTKNEADVKQVVRLTDANMIVSSVSAVNDMQCVYATKQGRVIRQNYGGPDEILYQVPDKGGIVSIPWAVAAAPDGAVYFTDLERREILRIDGKMQSPVVSQELIKKQGFETESYVYYRISVNANGTIGSCNESSILVQSADGKIVLYTDSLSNPAPIIMKKAFNWILIVIGILIIAVIGRIFYVNIMNRRISDVLIKVSGIIIVLIVSAVLISSMIVKNFSERYQKEAFNKVSQLVQVFPSIVDSSCIERITKQGDYMNADYRSVRDSLLNALNYNRDEWNSSYYFALYRVDGEKFYGFMYLSGEIGAYYPFSYYDDPEGVYRKAQKGEIATEGTSDEWGTWLYSVGPIKNSKGDVVALLEVGTDLYTFTQENNRLVRAIIMDVITMLVIFVFIMIEVTFLRDMLRRRTVNIMFSKQNRTLRTEDRYSDIFISRPITFVFYTAVSMSVVFIPLMMNTFYKEIPHLSKELVLGLPISFEMFFFGVSSIYAGSLVARRGWRTVSFIGFGITIAGLLFSALSFNMISFLGARSITGIGGGMFFIAMRGLINTESDEDMRSEGFSHFYSAIIVGLSIGAVVGGIIADKLGYPAVFFTASAIVVIAVILNAGYLKDLFLSKPVTEKQLHEKPKISVFSFLTDLRVVSFFILIILPTFIAGTFLSYYFPMYAESHNLSSSDVGRIFILNGIFIIYLGPILSRFFNRYLGYIWSMLLGSLLWGCALVIVALTGNISGAIIAIIIMGISEGFCLNAQNSYYVTLPQSKAIGVGKALGYFEMASKFSETLGPIIFSAGLVLGQIYGLSVMGAGVLACGILFAVIAGRKTK